MPYEHDMHKDDLMRFAAKLCGVPVYKSEEGIVSYGNTFTGGIWDPLNDDGDAFRLSVYNKLELSYFCGLISCVVIEENNMDRTLVEFRFTDDIARDARRAIVTAAAILGSELE